MELERKREREKVEEKKSCGARKIKKKQDNKKGKWKNSWHEWREKKCGGGGKKGRTSEDNESAGKGRKLKDEKWREKEERRKDEREKKKRDERMKYNTARETKEW